MSEVRDPEKKPEHEKKNDRDFISEKIVRPAPWQQLPVPESFLVSSLQSVLF